MSKKVIKEALGHIFRGIDMLQKQFSNKLFTIDGRLVGDIGEIILRQRLFACRSGSGWPKG